MNGSDLRFLAERASVLDERPVERLAEVRERIAATRRRRTAAAAGSALLVVLLAVGLAVVVNRDAGDPAPAPAPTPVPAPTTAVETTVPEPPVGTCWAVPARSVTDATYFYDDSPQVPCTEAHTTETVAVFPLDEPTPQAAMVLADRCWSAALSYVGVDRKSWVPWTFTGYLPSRQQVADGAAWARCDAIFPTHADYSGVRTTTRSAKGIADVAPIEYWGCLDEDPANADQSFVPCTRPHAYEQTGTVAEIIGEGSYPPDDVLEQEAQSQCAPAVPPDLAGGSVTALWDPRSVWSPYQVLAGVCFVFRADGEPLPAR